MRSARVAVGVMNRLESNVRLAAGFGCLVIALVWALIAAGERPPVFRADGSFATLADFTVLALALERLVEAVLAP